MTNVPVEIEPATYPAQSRVQFLRVPWDSDYRNVVTWDRKDRDTWFANRMREQTKPTSFVMDDFSYLPFGRPIMVDMSIDQVQQYNYLTVNNTSPSSTHVDYCYFILRADYVSPDTTAVVLQLDVWQTWHDTVSLGRCFVERGHVGIADVSNSVDKDNGFYGQRFLTTPEGLDTGAAHNITSTKTFSLIEDNFCIMVTATQDMTADAGTVSDPKIVMSPGSGFELGLDAAQILVFEDIGDYRAMTSAIAKKPWLAQSITSVTAIPDSFLSYIKNNSGIKKTVTIDGTTFSAWVGFVVKKYGKDPSNLTRVENFRDQFTLPNRYRHLKKFLTFPYAAIELTTLQGQSVILQPERVREDQLAIEGLSTFTPTAPRITMYPVHYGAGDTAKSADFVPSSGGGIIDAGEGINHAVTIDNFPRFSVLSNAGLMYMATNAKSISQSRDAALWGQQKSQAAAQLAYGQASKNIETASELNSISIDAMDQHRALSNFTAGMGAATSGVSNLLNGDFGSALTTGVNYAIGVNQTNQSFAIDSNRMNQSTAVNASNSRYMRDTNKQYADMAAKGDYAQTIAAINARVQDSQIVSPMVSGAAGGDVLSFLYRTVGLAIRFRQLPPAAMSAIGEFWLRYGYAVNRWCVPPWHFMTMTNFTYWKMLESTVFSDRCPEEFVQTIRGILEKGVTVWRDPDLIGQYGVIGNEPITWNYLNLSEME